MRRSRFSHLSWTSGWTLAVALGVWVCVSCAKPESQFDVLLKGGVVIDGTGAGRRVADVALREDRIALVADAIAPALASTVIDVSGLVVAPGFWDNHAHLVELEQRPQAENFLRQGITTILASLHSQDQVSEMATYRERVRMAPNVGLFAGHTWIRKEVLGLEDRAPSSEELQRMKALVADAMEQGALGFATGLEYVPSVYAKVDEIVELARVAGRFGGRYVTHLRDEGVEVMAAVEEAIEVGRRAEVPVQINHIKVTGAAHFGQSEQVLARIDQANTDGVDVVFDVYPYTAYSTYSDLMFPAWVLADGTDAFAERVADPETRQRLEREMVVRFTQQAGAGPDSIQFRTLRGFPELSGKSLADYLIEQGQEVSVASGVKALIELQLNGGFIGIFHGMSEQDVAGFVRHPRAMFETDGDLVQFGEGHPHPRSYGSFPLVLTDYVERQGILTLEEAIHRMTSMPASWWSHSDRGELKAGNVADIVVLDLERLDARSTYSDPHHYSEGVVHLYVNGEAVIQDSKVTGQLPGRFLDRNLARTVDH